MDNINYVLEWVQAWAEKLVDLVESMKAWFEYFFPAEEDTSEA